MSDPRTVAIIQARMGSTRLPGKVRMAVCSCPRPRGEQECATNNYGHSVLASVIDRAQMAKTLDEVVVATSELSTDDVIVRIGESCRSRVFRGSERDLLLRYIDAAAFAGATSEHKDIVVRLTADCPLIDPGIIDRAVRELKLSDYDFTSTSAEGFDPKTGSIARTFPKGLDVEACRVDVLHRCDRLFKSPRAREHVFTGIYEEAPNLFLIGFIRDRTNHGGISLAVDTVEDLARVRSVYGAPDYDGLIERCRERGYA